MIRDPSRAQSTGGHRTTDTAGGQTGRTPEPGTARLTRYRDLLASAPLNLTSVHDPAEIERRHIAESLAVARALEAVGALPSGARAIDVGSGGGLPGIPLAIVRSDVSVTLLEATGKKAAFLAGVAAVLELANVRVLVARAEDAAHDPAERETYDVAVARAVAPLVTLVELTLPFVRLGGILAAVKGSRVVEEIEQAGVALRRCGGGAVAIAALGDVESPLSLVTVSKVEPSPPELPRRAGMPAKRPLR